MNDDEFWIEACKTDGHVATVSASFNAFIVTINVERNDGGPICEAEAQRAYTAVMERAPRRIRLRHVPGMSG